ncbi:hypothetical protein RRG08_040553 [Elysia crispata]|uniref:Uncharacterized protein n=1 Tax=Elysia crispata TaxID=231223 RepID=A0AAE0Z9U1_9GAST|nr:hypothetical protein RRG08_040553 [Elysia crispata]
MPNYPHNGQRCLKCHDRCPGLELHYFRKICNHCRCLAEDHDLPSCQQRDCRPMSMLFQSSLSPRDPASSSPSPSPLAPPSPPSPVERPSDWSTQFEKLSLVDPGDLTQLKPPQNDVVLTKLISENVRSQKFISMLPEDKQEFASNLRRKQLQRQLPLHDLDPRFCNSLAQSEAGKFEKFADRRRKKAAGIGQIGEVASEGSLVGCAGCQQKMEKGSPAVVAGRVPGECWHPGCFACTTCKQLLVDMIYFHKKGRIYCERHYADLLYPRCSACDEIIFSREYTQAEGRSWHVQHFCCWYCDAPLAGQRYIAKDNNPYCVVCFDKLFSKICGTCQRPITAEAPGVTHGEFHWHACPHCFSCHACGRTLLNQPFMLTDGKIYCTSNCRHRSGPTCLTASIARQYTH